MAITDTHLYSNLQESQNQLLTSEQIEDQYVHNARKQDDKYARPTVGTDEAF